MTAVVAHVSEYMTSGPFAVGPREPLGNAARLMDKYGLHHLPVSAEGKLVGIISGRDVELFKALAGGLLDDAVVEQAMTRDPYAVSPDTPLVEVVRTMAERRIGSAVVLEGGRVAGVFTATDAMHVLVGALEGKLFAQRGAAAVVPHRPRAPRRPPAR